MRKALFVFLLLAIPAAAFAQSDDDWRNRGSHDRWRYDRGRDNYVELTPFIGYRYGGTLYASESDLFRRNVDLASSANFGVNFAFPINNEGMKIELMVSRQNTHFTNGDQIFTPGTNLGDFHVTYYQAGLQIPFAQSRQVIPYAIVSAGVANLDPEVPNVQTNASNRFAGSAGVGAKIPLQRNLALRIEARGYFTSLTRNNDNCSSCFNDYNHDLYQGETNFGIDFRF